MYRFWLGESNKWQFCSSETKDWDYYHQMAFRQHKVKYCEFSDIADEVPPLPDEFSPPVKYHVKVPSQKSLLETLPGAGLVRRVRRVLPGNWLLKKICAAPENRLPAYVVLREEKYEFAFGDGIFRNFESAHLDEDAAKAHIDQYFSQPRKWSEFYIRTVRLILSGWTFSLDTRDSDLSPYNDFTRKQIVKDLEHPE